MNRNILYTYNNLEEFNQLILELQSQGKELYPFFFQETKELIENESDVIIDITHLVELLDGSKQDRLSANFNLRNLDNTNRIVVRKDLAERALHYFPHIFYSEQPLYSVKTENENYLPKKIVRRTLYTYKNNEQLKKFIDFVDQHHIPFFSFSQANRSPNVELSLLDKSETPPIIDITTMIRAALVNNAPILYLSEQLIDSLPNTIFIVNKNSAMDVLENMPIFFDRHSEITELYPELMIDKEVPSKEQKLKRIIDCDVNQLKEFEQILEDNLVGHLYFKEQFSRASRNFVRLNRIKEKKILSVFLLGQSGLGKTEVARIIKNFLNPSASLAKINFGNYSSQDALNSLIGSPAGYVGCESGELGIKVQKSKAGVIVCDEFEKTTRPVYNFFLELLEDGNFTDSLTREYDLDGYIIVFTSNLPTANEFYKQIPLELQSRMDLVCEFKPLTLSEKKVYVEYQLKRYMDRLSEEFSKHEVSPEVFKKLANVNYQGTDNLRDIKRMVEQNVIEFLNV